MSLEATIHPSNLAARRPRPRAPLPLQPLLDRLKNGAAVSSNIYALVRRIMLLILQRVASIFKVKLEHQGFDDDSIRPEAAYTADPDFDDRVNDASKVASLALSKFVQAALAQNQTHHVSELARLQDAAPAFLSLSLDQIGQALSAAAAEVARLKQEVGQQVDQVAAKLGVPAGSLRTLLQRGEITAESPMAADADVGVLVAKVAELERASQQWVRLKVSYCDHCVAAHQVDAAGELGSIAKRKAMELGDSSLVNAVEMALAHTHTCKEDIPKNGISTAQTALNSALTQQKQPQPATVGDRGTSRRRLSVGVVDAALPGVIDDEDFAEVAAPPLRER